MQNGTPEILTIVASDVRGITPEQQGNPEIIRLIEECKRKLGERGLTCYINNPLNRWLPGKGYEVIFQDSKTPQITQSINFSPDRSCPGYPLVSVLQYTIGYIGCVFGEHQEATEVIESSACPSYLSAISLSPSKVSTS